MTDPIDLPAALLAAFNRYGIRSAHNRELRQVPPFYVVDESTAEPDVNWPGDLVSEHTTYAAARLALMKVALESIGVLRP